MLFNGGTLWSLLVWDAPCGTHQQPAPPEHRDRQKLVAHTASTHPTSSRVLWDPEPTEMCCSQAQLPNPTSNHLEHLLVPLCQALSRLRVRSPSAIPHTQWKHHTFQPKWSRLGVTRCVTKPTLPCVRTLNWKTQGHKCLGGRQRALPGAWPGPWYLSPSSRHQEGCFSEYRAPQICVWCAALTCQCFQAFPSTSKQSGSVWSFSHFSVEEYIQKERSVSDHQEENEGN